VVPSGGRRSVAGYGLGVQIAETDWVVKNRLKELQAEEQKKKQPQN